ncbi:MAG: protoheme farnesyltransferase, partial [Candidatus Saccharibacteria bacterium]|nr:protoheme farnesyltransferase [Candidatus Saccharibacteria bacterium]
MLKAYYRLTKPGIIYGNLLTAIGGFLFGAQGDINPYLLVAMSVGTSMIIASACVFNNYIDRDIDAYMARTKKRALVSKQISPTKALIFGGALGLIGVIVLYCFTNIPTLALGIIGFVSYVFLYTFSKRRTVYSTLIGSISGSTPIAAGYTAATGQFDSAALILFLIMAIWQLPHFYAIGIFRRDDYAAAGVPILSVVKG